MDRNIKQIVVFGDSFMAGDELLQNKHLDNIIPILDRYKASIAPTGKLQCQQKDLRAIRDAINCYFDKEYPNPQDRRSAEFKETYASKLGERLDVPVIHYARPGTSHLGIYDSFLQFKNRIDSNTLVLIGTTYINRYTQLTPKAIIHETNQYLKDEQIAEVLQSWGTTIPHHSSQANEKKHKTFYELDSVFGNDGYFKYLQFISTLYSIKYMLGDIPHYFFCNTGNHTIQFVDLATDLHLIPPHKRYYIRQELDKLIVPYSLQECRIALQEQNLPFSALFGHVNSDVHTHYSDYLFNFLKDNN